MSKATYHNINKICNEIHHDITNLGNAVSHAFDGPDETINALLSGLTTQGDIGRYPVNKFDDFSDSEDEKPQHIPRMITVEKVIFDIKPKKIKPVEKPTPVPHPAPVVLKQILTDRSCQCENLKFSERSCQTPSTANYVDSAIIAHDEAETQTEIKKPQYANSSVNTDDVFKSYEQVICDFLEQLLQDAPLLVPSQPSQGQIEGLLYAFLQQLLADSQNYDNDGQNPQTPQRSDLLHEIKYHQQQAKNDKIIYNTKATQLQITTQNAITQSQVTLLTREPVLPIVNLEPINRQFKGSPISYDLFDSKPISHKMGTVNNSFQLPPSLKASPEIRPILVTKSIETDKTPKEDMHLTIQRFQEPEVKPTFPQKQPKISQIETNESEAISIAPTAQKQKQMASIITISNPPKSEISDHLEPEQPEEPIIQLREWNEEPPSKLDTISGFQDESILKQVGLDSSDDDFNTSLTYSGDVSNGLIESLLGSPEKSDLSSGELPPSDNDISSLSNSLDHKWL